MSALPTPACKDLPIAVSGHVLQMQGMSVNDGEGIRTVIFLSGCPLRCRWCANPETWSVEPKLAVYHSKCIGCGACAQVCPVGINPPQVDSPRQAGCIACGRCVDECPSGALKILIHEQSLDEIVRKIERDELFFRNSGGGVTFSGGEPTAQAPFLRAMVNKLYDRGIDLCIETCGYFKWEEVKDIFAKFSRVLFDIKHMDDATHRELTGVSNQLILENCQRIVQAQIPITVRVPVIDGVNGTTENLTATARFMAEKLASLPGADVSVELLPYHDLGVAKYRAIGQAELTHTEYTTPSNEKMEEFEDLFRAAGITVVRYR